MGRRHPLTQTSRLTIGVSALKILIVEDDKIIGDGIQQGLSLQGYATDWVEDKESGETALKRGNYDMLVLDIGLPDGSGVDLLASLRRKGNDMPVLILTAYDDVNYRVKGLDAGADDYMVKPFELKELAARVRALHRRAGGRASPTLTAGDIELDPAAHRVTKSGQKIDVGPKEFTLLQLLMEKQGKVVSKQQLEDSLYGWSADIGSNTVEVHMHGLRKKLGKELIQTIRNVGYTLNVKGK